MGCARRCETPPARAAGTAAAVSGRRNARPCRRWEAPSPSGLGALAALGAFLSAGLGLLLLFLGFLRRFRLLGNVDAAAGRLDHRARALGDADLFERNLALELAREDHLGGQSFARNQARRLQRGEVDLGCLERLQVADAHFGNIVAGGRIEAALRQAPMQRHLSALEADLVEAAGAGALALVTAARGFAPAGADAAADAVAVLLGAGRRFESIKSHRCAPGS